MSHHHDPDHDELLAHRGQGRRAGRWDVSHTREDIWQRLSQITCVCIVLVGLACSFVFFKPEIERRDQLKREVEVLAGDYENKRADTEALEAELAWLRSDLYYLESRARDLLDLQKDGEQIIRVIRPE